MDEMLAGERSVFSTEKHWIAPLRDSAIAILLLIGAVVLRAISPDGEGIVGTIGDLLDLIVWGMVIVAAVSIVYNIVVWRTATFVVTNFRVIREEGLLSRKSSATMLKSVTDVQSQSPFLGAQLGYGDLVIFTQSGDAGADRFKTITRPKEFRDQMMVAKMQADGAVATPPSAAAPVAAPPPVAVPPSMPPAAPTTATSSEQLKTLEQLAALRDSGAITAEEYEAKKTELLGRI